MILTCPECESRYVVDDARVGPKGRTVRCVQCGSSWRAEPPPAEAETSAEGPAPPPPVVAPAEPAPAQIDNAARPAPLPERIRAEAQEKKKSREAIVSGIAWAALAAGFVALVLSAILFRVDVVRLWPQTASAYAFAKMPVNPTGLALVDVQGQPNLINGHAALSVTGVERNVETVPRHSIPLRVILYNKAGARLASSVSAPPTVQIAAGDSKTFAVNFLDPPADLSTFMVEFAFDKIPPKGAAPPSPPHPAPMKAQARLTPSVAGPPAQPLPAAPLTAPIIQAEDAKSLPPTSPYALPPSAIQQPSH